MNYVFSKSGLRVGGGKALEAAKPQSSAPAAKNSAPKGGDAGQPNPGARAHSAGIDNSARKGGSDGHSECDARSKAAVARNSGARAGRGGAVLSPAPSTTAPLPSGSARNGGGAGRGSCAALQTRAGTKKSRLRAGEGGHVSRAARKTDAALDNSGLRPGVTRAASSTAPADEARGHDNSGLRVGRGGAGISPSPIRTVPLPAFFRDTPDDEPATQNMGSAPISPAVDNSRSRAGARSAKVDARPATASRPGDNPGRKVGGGEPFAGSDTRGEALPAKNSGREVGASEAIAHAITRGVSPPRKSSRLVAGAARPNGEVITYDPQPGRNNSGASAPGDGARVRQAPDHETPHRENPVASGRGSAARTALNPRGRMPHSNNPRGDAGPSPASQVTPSDVASPGSDTSPVAAGASPAIPDADTADRPPGSKSPGRKARVRQASDAASPEALPPASNIPGLAAGADAAGPAVIPIYRSPHPYSSGRKVGRSKAGKDAPPDMPSPAAHNSGFGRGDQGQHPFDTHGKGALIAEIVQLGRARRDWLKTRIGIELRAMAICRRFVAGDKDAAKVLWGEVQAGQAPADLMFAVAPLLPSIASLREEEKRVDRQMTKLIGSHPMAAWAKGIRGFGHAGLAKVVAECGDVGSYRNPSCVWKRLGVAVINGERQRRVPGADALVHGYNAERRSVLWNVGGAIIGGMGRGPRPLVGEDIDAREDLTALQKLFVRRLRYEAERDPEAHAREPVLNKETGALKESFSAHAANRAKRYVEKRLLRDLWIAWRRERRDSLVAE